MVQYCDDILPWCDGSKLRVKDIQGVTMQSCDDERSEKNNEQSRGGILFIGANPQNSAPWTPFQGTNMFWVH